MARQLKAALCAATFLFASQVQAANFLVVDIAAGGTGLGYRNVGSTVESFEFTKYFASLSYYLEGPLAPQLSGNTISVIGANSLPRVFGTFSTNGFDFSAAYPDSRNSYRIAGNACYTNGSPPTVTTGSPNIDPSCGSITVSNNSGSAQSSYNFAGTITGINFRVVQANTLPDITFAIPEPSTWALMLAGFGMIGYSLRRKRATVAIA